MLEVIQVMVVMVEQAEHQNVDAVIAKLRELADVSVATF